MENKLPDVIGSQTARKKAQKTLLWSYLCVMHGLPSGEKETDALIPEDSRHALLELVEISREVKRRGMVLIETCVFFHVNIYVYIDAFVF